MMFVCLYIQVKVTIKVKVTTQEENSGLLEGKAMLGQLVETVGGRSDGS